MKAFIYLKYLTLVIVGVVFFVSLSQAALLESNVVGEMTNNTSIVAEGNYGQDVTIGSVVATIIKAFLALLGVIFVILMVVAGFNWMTAGGEEEKITKAKDTIRAAVIGLVIIVAAYSITYFVFENLSFDS